MKVIDCHVHIQPWNQLKPEVLARMKNGRKDYDEIQKFIQSPEAFVEYLDSVGISQAWIINYDSPDLMGFSFEVNRFCANYCKKNPQRLIPFGSVNPRNSKNVTEDLKKVIDWGIRGIKLHPPHQLFSPNDYLSSHRNLEELYRFCELKKLPVMFHTGTSIFPGARSRYGNPIPIDDVAVDFPNLKIILAHGGRPLWQQEAFFLVRRHPNVYLEISGIPPAKVLESFPRLEEIASKTLFGTDWPGPGVVSIAKNIEDFKKLKLSDEAKENILHKVAEQFFS
jgi:hypothetical protein